MDEIITLIRKGCGMARILEESLPNAANHPERLFSSCTEIINQFSKVKENIRLVPQEQHQLDPTASSGVPEWLMSGHIPATDLPHPAQLFLGGPPKSSALLLPGPPADAKMKGVIRDQEAAGGSLSAVVGAEVAASPSGPRGSSSQRQRRRLDGATRRVEVPAPRIGNTEIPPEDGFTWRKYGQKNILHSSFPRSYFRCTHQKLYNCPAKKQVQRLDDDPSTFVITYRGEHTCHLSSTAPSVPPPPSHNQHPQLIRQQQDMIHQQQITTTTVASVHLDLIPVPSAFTSQWLSMDISARGRDPNVGRQHIVPTSTNMITFATGAAAAIAGPSTSRTPYARDHQHVEYLQQPVTDMADAMFNSGSSSNTSMDLIFSSMDDKWDSGEKKN